MGDGYVQAFIGKLRDEPLDREISYMPFEAKVLVRAFAVVLLARSTA